MIRTGLLLATALTVTAPAVRADAYLVPLTGKDGKPADYGYTLRTVEIGKKKLIYLELTPAAAKAFGHGELTLTKGGQTVVEATVAIVKDGKGNGTLKLTIDPAAIDGGELTIWSAPIEGAPLVHNFGGFRLSVAALLETPKEDKPDDEAAIATHIKALSDTNSETRAAAAEALRRILARYPSGTVYLASKDGGEADWQAKIDRVEPGMAKAEVLKLLPPFAKGSEGGEICDGDSHIVSYRLDYHWMVRITYRNTDKVIERPVLLKRALRVHLAPPKDFTGTWTTWHINGQKGYEIQYKDGRYDGVFTSYHDTGTKSYEQHYVNHVAHGPDTGWNADGRLSYTGQYRNGQQDGRWTHWHANGKKHSEADYADGKYHGRVTYWHENGQIGSVNEYKEGIKHGREASWDKKGALQYDRKFVNGKIVDAEALPPVQPRP
jgi:antitoxin component YwqK of YwqJK toxin-antitoxin module